MNFRYETKRLILTVGNESMAEAVAAYLIRNREDFSKWETTLTDSCYTPEYQTNALTAEQKLFMKGEGVRYYISPKEFPDLIIGNVSFAYLKEENGHRCSLGYKVDSMYRRQGIAYEAISFLMPVVIKKYRLKRIEADILPENRASLALIEKLGFRYEGVARASHEIAGCDRDHLRYSFLG